MYKTRSKASSQYEVKRSALNDLGVFITQIGRLMNESGKVIILHTGKKGNNQKWKTLRNKQ